MARGFFSKSSRLAVKRPGTLTPKCGACGLLNHCKSPKMEPAGEGRRSILIVGEAPGAEEDKKGQPFVGQSGRMLEAALDRVGIDLWKDCVVTNSIVCHPEDNRTPTSEEVGFCRPNVIRAINDFNPEIVVPLGTPAVQSVIGYLFKDSNIGGVARWSGWRIPVQKINAWVCPTFHPSFILQSDKSPVPRLMFNAHLEQISELRGRPWKKIPNYKERIEIIFDPDDAARAIREIIEDGGPISFDYETNCLSPYDPLAEIVSAAVCLRGQRTIAFPWLGRAIKAMSELLRSWCKKIGANIKFEDHWTRVHLGHEVKNWAWDTVNVAHCIDNRPDITSVKHQAFALLGADSYDDHIKPLLKARKGEINRISEIDLRQLLFYNGLDALLEYLIAKVQQKWIRNRKL